ncbi:MAG: GAF domain-containing protein [Nannocystaceae bacterium]|nr:GAF domain-containing protein [Myxococcales bacterium]
MSEPEGQVNLKNQTEAFLHEFFGKGEVFVRQLIQENERLRRELNAAHPARPDNPEIAPASVVEHLVARVTELEALVSRGEQDGFPLLNARIEELETENYHLAAMYVAGLQFHAGATIAEVLRTATEILLNFVGVGAFTIYGVDEERRVLFPIDREGGDIDELDEVPLDGDAPLASLYQRARPWSRGDDAYALDGAIMHLPMVSRARLMAVIRLEAFLAQKSEFIDNDYSLLSMISEHAGIALESAWHRAHSTDVPLQRVTVEQLVGA